MTIDVEKKLKFYLDTTIPNYVFAEELPEKMKSTKKLFENIRSGKYKAYVSNIVIGELSQTEEPKRSKLLSQIKDLEKLPVTKEAIELAENYVRNEIISKNYLGDAYHIAIATVHNIDAVISWNFEHMVNINKIRKINIINEIMGFKHIEIISPEEVD